MQESKKADQAAITRWFDHTYATRGSSYLRPLHAYRIMPKLLQLKTDHTLLDVACGLGLMLAAGRECGAAVTGIDISAVGIAGAKVRLPEARLAVASAEGLPFADQSFDRLTCLGSLERMLDQEMALSEMSRVLKPDGKLVIMVRNSKTLTWLIKRALGLVNERGHQGADTLGNWRERMINAGLTVEAVHPDQWPLIRWRYWLGRHIGRVPENRVRSGWLPLRYTNEFIFVCSPRGPAGHV